MITLRELGEYPPQLWKRRTWCNLCDARKKDGLLQFVASQAKRAGSWLCRQVHKPSTHVVETGNGAVVGEELCRALLLQHIALGLGRHGAAARRTLRRQHRELATAINVEALINAV